MPQTLELFLIMANARLAMGQISLESYSCDTADGAGKDRQSALLRLARCVCADLEEIGDGAALAIARQAAEHGLERVVAAGTGEGLIAEAAAFLGMECVSISERYGREIGCLSGLCCGQAGGDARNGLQFHLDFCELLFSIFLEVNNILDNRYTVSYISLILQIQRMRKIYYL